jgi:hypothetical protein
MRTRLSYANVTATLALIFAMSSGALAANHYLINSTRQISPRVLKALKGNAGSRGVAGAAGTQGSRGERGERGEKGEKGERGEPGPYPTVLASGATESGDWGSGLTVGEEKTYDTVASFPIPLPSGVNSEHVVYTSEASTAHCPGAGQAERGYLCLYQRSIEDAHTPINLNVFNPEENGPSGAGTHGFAISLKSEKAGLSKVTGTFAVTAP